MRRVGVALEVRVGRAARVGEAEREHRRVLVSADLHGQAMPALAQRERDAEALAVEISVLCILQDLLAVEEDLRGSGGPEPDGEWARPGAGLAGAAIAHERGRVGADLLGGPDHRAEVDPAVREDVGRHAVRDGPLLAVVGAGHAQRIGELVLGAERAVEPALALVVERPGDHPAADEAEALDARLRAREVAAAAARVGLEETGIGPEGRGQPRVRGEGAERLLDLGGVTLIPLGPELA